MPLHIKKTDRAWLRYAQRHTAEPEHTCREPTAIERLSAAGYTRRASGGLVWFEDGDGRRTAARETLDAAVKAALEAINA